MVALGVDTAVLVESLMAAVEVPESANQLGTSGANFLLSKLRAMALKSLNTLLASPATLKEFVKKGKIGVVGARGYYLIK